MKPTSKDGKPSWMRLTPKLKTFEFKADNVPPDEQVQSTKTCKRSVPSMPRLGTNSASCGKPAVRAGAKSNRNWKLRGRICKTACNALRKV